MNKDHIYCRQNNYRTKSCAAWRGFADPEIANRVSTFHSSLPNYKATPVVNLAQLAQQLGIKQLVVKDESHRFGLNAFKVLGASYAIAKYLARQLAIPEDVLLFDNIIAHKSKYQNSTFVTATDGNHGRAVAWAAQLFGCKSVVYMPKNSSKSRLEAIQKCGAKASITAMNYDDTVLYAEQMAQKQGWYLLQDTSWQGYRQVPQDIMQGYFTLVTELLRQEEEFWPTHVFLQAGVGSFPAAIAAYMSSFGDCPTPQFVVVEPHGAPCFYRSIEKGRESPVQIEGDLTTIMAGLACGKTSLIAWDILKSVASFYLTCSDDIARKGMRVLGNPLKGDRAIISGESGAVTLGALFDILSYPHYRAMKDKLGLGSNSKILLISTEGDTDPVAYRSIVCGEGCTH